MATSLELKMAKSDISKKINEMFPKAKEMSKNEQGDVRKYSHDDYYAILDDYYAILKAIKRGAETIEDLNIEFRSEIIIEILHSYQKENNNIEEQSEKVAEEQNETSSVDIMSKIFAGTLYHCVIDGKAFGPVTIRQFANMARYGIVNANTMVWTQGMSQWAIAQSIADLQTVV